MFFCEIVKNGDSIEVVSICHSRGQWIERVPAWTRLAWQDHTTNLFNGVHWEPPKEEQHVFKHQRPAKPTNLKIYEAHVGMASSEPKVATYADFARDVLPRVKRMGYNAVQLMAIAEHAHYGCFGCKWVHMGELRAISPQGRGGWAQNPKIRRSRTFAVPSGSGSAVLLVGRLYRWAGSARDRRILRCRIEHPW